MSDAYYHTVIVEHLTDGDYHVLGLNNAESDLHKVGSVAIGDALAGVKCHENESFRLEAADSFLTVEVLDFTDQHGYKEAQINFHDRDDVAMGDLPA